MSASVGPVVEFGGLKCGDPNCVDCFPVSHPTTMHDAVHHPAHYGGETNPYEAIRVIIAWDLGFCLGNTVKYISRAGKKDPDKKLEDLQKARWYLDREIQEIENAG